MRPLIGVLAFALTGCGGFPVVLGSHTSDPSTSSCDSTTDHAGGGKGWVAQHEKGNTRVYATLGAKHVRPCGAPDQTALGGQLLIIHEFLGVEP
jgi:hypothetical protein